MDASNTLDVKLKLWRQWLEYVGNDIADLLREKAYYTELTEIVSNNVTLKNYKSYFWVYLYRTYVTTASVGVRRQFPGKDEKDNDNKNISMGKILKGMSECSFDELMLLNVNRQNIQIDITTLEKAVSKVRPLVNKRIAHTQRSFKPIRVPSINEIFDAINLLYELFKKYYSVINPCNVGIELSPITVRPNEFEELFSLPWIERK